MIDSWYEDQLFSACCISSYYIIRLILGMDVNRKSQKHPVCSSLHQWPAAIVKKSEALTLTFSVHRYIDSWNKQQMHSSVNKLKVKCENKYNFYALCYVSVILGIMHIDRLRLQVALGYLISFLGMWMSVSEPWRKHWMCQNESSSFLNLVASLCTV